MPNEKYPTLYIGYEKGFAGNNKQYEFDHINARLTYDITLGNKGNLAMNIKGGKFYNATGISFVDYKHFNGNQTHIGQADRYLNVFNLLPYYANSTNDSYIESHFEHDDKGYLSEQILSTTMFRVYRSIGGDSTQFSRRGRGRCSIDWAVGWGGIERRRFLLRRR